MKEKVYVAGAYRSGNIIGVIWNILRARRVAKQLAAAGFWVFCPHLNWALMDNVQPDKFWLACGQEMVKYCDAIYMMRGWENSTGAKDELALALRLHKRVIYNDTDTWVSSWLKGIQEPDLIQK